MRMAKVALLLLLTVVALSLYACKNTETRPTSLELKLFTAGDLPVDVKIGAIDVTVALAPGFSPASAPSSTTMPHAVEASGVAATGSLIASKWSAPTSTTAGTVRVGLINVPGFGIGEFVTIRGDITDGYNPGAADFSVIAFSVADFNGRHLTGLTAGFTADIR
jgi:hypothetical protein